MSRYTIVLFMSAVILSLPVIINLTNKLLANKTHKLKTGSCHRKHSGLSAGSAVLAFHLIMTKLPIRSLTTVSQKIRVIRIFLP